MDRRGLGIQGVSEDGTFDPLQFLAYVALNEAAIRDSLTRQPQEGEDIVQEMDNQDVEISENAVAGSSVDREMRTSPEVTCITDDESEEEEADQTNESDGIQDEARDRGGAEQRSNGEVTTTNIMEQLNIMDSSEEAYLMEDMEANGELGENEEDDTMSNSIAATGILPEADALISSLEDRDEDIDALARLKIKRRRIRTLMGKEYRGHEELDFFLAFRKYPELLMDMAIYLPMEALVSLYAISKDFHYAVNGHLTHVMKTYANNRAPESARVFIFTLYGSLCVRDPVDRPDPINPDIRRMVPSIRWLKMVLHRDRVVHDILACMAREGHRMPKTMPLSIKKMWIIMDIATSARRVQLMHNEKYWTDNDIYNIQMFIVKLEMRFNDPIDGPGDDGLKKLMLGQRGLTPLWKLLKRTAYTDTMELLETAIRYCYTASPEHRHLPIFGVPPHEIGRGHLEGWGKGLIHLYRPDELIMREACRRNLKLTDHLLWMVVWGYVNKETKENIEVTEKEMRFSDAEEEDRLGEGTRGKKTDQPGPESGNGEVDEDMLDMGWMLGNEDMPDATEQAADQSAADQNTADV